MSLRADISALFAEVATIGDFIMRYEHAAG
jgi:hypothetical protein